MLETEDIEGREGLDVVGGAAMRFLKQKEARLP
jgi:hypothetical protein